MKNYGLHWIPLIFLIVMIFFFCRKVFPLDELQTNPMDKQDCVVDWDQVVCGEQIPKEDRAPKETIHKKAKNNKSHKHKKKKKSKKVVALHSDRNYTLVW
jgi:hypothetical protein